jgi:hypothetical protein
LRECAAARTTMSNKHLAPPAQHHRHLSARERHHRALVTVAAALGLFMAISAYFAPTKAEFAEATMHAYTVVTEQGMTVSSTAPTVEVTRAVYDATPGVKTLKKGGTNRDWAKLVLLYGGWELSDNNVTVFMRWMRQENGTNNWWNRNNPMNNGWGSGGGGGTGTYPNLDIAAKNAADALHSNPGYAGIVASFKKSASMTSTAKAIWASPWATGHYANGDHWSTAPVPVVKAPASAWG